jgi:hypothetical protein
MLPGRVKRFATILVLAFPLALASCQPPSGSASASPPPAPRWEYTFVVAMPVIRATNAAVTPLNSITAPREPEGSPLDAIGAATSPESRTRPVVLKARYRDDVQISRWAMGPPLVAYANELGGQGWELVSAETFLHFTNMDGRRFEGLTLVFRRRL